MTTLAAPVAPVGPVALLVHDSNPLPFVVNICPFVPPGTYKLLTVLTTRLPPMYKFPPIPTPPTIVTAPVVVLVAAVALAICKLPITTGPLR